ncbi:MAG: hypothetical protein LAT67_04195 [Balneolales bacterium]|nr:hypothetical protein [Balneolales bacterium]
MKSKKKLLILCSVPQMIKIVRQANEYGLHTVVVDNVKGSACKLISSEYYDYSVFDIDKIVETSKEVGIDGVMNYCIDSGQIPYCEIADKLDLPCYGTREQFEIMTNKEIFKESCLKYGLDVLISYDLNKDIDGIDISQIEFPIVIKPVDGRASKGVNICWNKNEIKSKLIDSLKHSKKKRVVAEEFVQNGQEVAVKYFVCDGDISLTSMSDIYTHYDEDGNRDYIWSQVFPSKHYEHFINEYDLKVRNFIKQIGIMNGPLSFSGFRKGDKYCFIDPSFRMGGAEDWEIVKANSGVDISTCLTHFAINGNMGNCTEIKKIDKSINKSTSMMLYFLIKEGVIGKIEGIEESTKIQNVVSHHVMYKEGDKIEGKGTAQHVIMRFIIAAESKENMIKTARIIQEKIKVFSIEGDSMLIENFPLDSL